ncbi:WD40 repeat-like protein [Coemansia sp. RSA 2611]|nr:WD40 repeat-like protein [Coemansia sp. RSA 2611]KAJ2700289.1 WD40 repeat-like protein [Coemansia sp. IMI 209128]
MSFVQSNYFAPNPATTRGQPVRLSTDPTGTWFVYASGRSIVIRNLQDPTQSREYTGHTQPTSVATFSPSGYYVASGDTAGNVRIWDSINDEHILKSEFRPISGRINDIAWDMDSQRVMAVGDGKEKFGHVFAYDSGNSLGTVEGHSKAINACSMRQQRPFRAVTCSDDGTCVFYHGAPYKFHSTLKDHSGFVMDAKYSPSNEYFVTAGADKKLFLYDGKTGALVRQVAADTGAPHTGSIYAVAWSPDSKFIVTSSGDCTCKFWDVAQDKLVGTVQISATSAPEHQQVGNLWAGSHIISLSLSGDINVLQMGQEQPVKAITGHQKAITAAALTPSGTLYTGSYDGKLCTWDFAGHAQAVEGPKSEAKPEDMAASSDAVALGFISDSVRFAQASKITGTSAGLSAAPISLAIDQSGTTVVAALANGELAIVTRTSVTKVPVKGEARAVAITGSTVAVGFADHSVHMYALQNSTLAATGVSMAANTREITRLAFTPNGQFLAAGDAGGRIVVAKAGTGETVTARWVAHTARIYGLAWAPDNQHAASSALDGHVIVWDLANPLRKTLIKHAHHGGASTVSFIDSQTLASTGADGAVKVWSLTQ